MDRVDLSPPIPNDCKRIVITSGMSVLTIHFMMAPDNVVVHEIQATEFKQLEAFWLALRNRDEWRIREEDTVLRYMIFDRVSLPGEGVTIHV